ncbi:Serine/threonine-protein phosphatase 2A 55 kDa regulatory subunit B beta isoform [Tupaia chinensis]|uniref:Serine/threonine-protein phosphatase 2A 55 kDa regulatory subunit B n=1 Tax=Tupaia chinensis TaxID=246437 RepID=L9KUQ6_TUPCH|nr:Serine/threonine-protein phosphatase 2A 55 kDa regulatory subunit B beta isoform [Tupaia chinensis]
MDLMVEATPRRVFANAHTYHINSISVNSDYETYMSADDLRINLWNFEITNQSFNIVDIKPANMEELTEVITAAEFHPHHCNTFVYSSSKGTIRLCDMRASALCDRHTKYRIPRHRCGRNSGQVPEKNMPSICEERVKRGHRHSIVSTQGKDQHQYLPSFLGQRSLGTGLDCVKGMSGQWNVAAFSFSRDPPKFSYLKKVVGSQESPTRGKDQHQYLPSFLGQRSLGTGLDCVKGMSGQWNVAAFSFSRDPPKFSYLKKVVGSQESPTRCLSFRVAGAVVITRGNCCGAHSLNWNFSALLFEEPEDPSNRSFFSEIISSISDVKFSHSGRYIMTRDYLTVKVWDLNMENRPIETYQVHDYLRSKLCSLYENDCIFDKFECVWNGSDSVIMTGSYNNFFRMFDRNTKRDVTLEASRENSKPRAILKPRKVCVGGKRRKDEISVDSLDFSKKILHTAWHPSENIIAVAATNNLYIFQDKVN